MFSKVIEDEEGVGDIIYFYNKYFINTIQPFIPYMANPYILSNVDLSNCSTLCFNDS